MGNAPALLGFALVEETETDVLLNSEPRKDAALLKDEDAAPSRTGHLFTVDRDLALCLFDEAADDIEARRLAATRGAEDAHEFGRGDREVDVLEHKNTPKRHPDVAKTTFTPRRTSSA